MTTDTQTAEVKPCPTCKGVGKAWQWRAYGNQQYHGDYYERCDTCDGRGTIVNE